MAELKTFLNFGVDFSRFSFTKAFFVLQEYQREIQSISQQKVTCDLQKKKKKHTKRLNVADFMI